MSAVYTQKKPIVYLTLYTPSSLHLVSTTVNALMTAAIIHAPVHMYLDQKSCSHFCVRQYILVVGVSQLVD